MIEGAGMTDRILIIDDDLDTLRLVGLLLERQGFEILAADNGSQGLTKAKEEVPDLILLDIMMPDMDGIEVARRMRADSITANIPIVFFTAKTQVEEKVAGFEAGADDYLSKPVHPKELTARVNAILARSGQRPAPTSEPEVPKGKVIGLLAARGGVGLTTLALNLGIILNYESSQDVDVTIAEMRPGQGTISLDLGYPNASGLTELLKRNANEIRAEHVENILVPHSSGVRLLLASYQPSDSQFLGAVPQVEIIAGHLSRLAKYTFLDLGPSLTPINDKLVDLCDQIIVALEPEPNHVTHAKALLDDLSLRVLGLDRIHLTIISKARTELKLTRNQIQDRLGHSAAFIFTPVPELAYQAAKAKTPLILFQAGESNTQQHSNLQQFKSLAQTILRHGQKVKI
jgi:pilus assembly protein CpaE